VKTMKVTRAQKAVLESLSGKDIAALRKNPALVAASKEMIAACRKIIRKVEAIPEYSSRKRRVTTYRRIATLARHALHKAGQSA
jgi:hypothetical protein